jgi:hypothetical protein
MLVNEKCTALKEVCDIFDLTNMVGQTSRINTYLHTFQKGNEQACAMNIIFIQFYFK